MTPTADSAASLLPERRERLREEAARRGLDGALVFAWRRRTLVWLTGYSPGFTTNHAALWLPADGRAILAVRFPFDRERAEAASGLEVRTDIEPHELLDPAVRRIGLVAGDFAIDECPPWLLGQLARRAVETVDLTPVVDEWRATKEAAELPALAEATRAGDLALAAAGAVAAVGQTDFELAGRVEASARAAGAQRALCLVGIGAGAFVTEPTGVATRSGDAVGLELTLFHGGACSQVNATILPETPGADAHRAVEACRTARRAIVAALQPGRPVEDAILAGEQVLADVGLLSAVEYDFGHGVGVDTPEYPRLIRGTGRRVLPGTVVAVHVAVRKPAGATAFIGGPVFVDSTGPHELVKEASWNSS